MSVMSLSHQVTSLLLLKHIYDVTDAGAWQTIYTILRQFFNDIINRNSLNSKKQMIFLKSFNLVLYINYSQLSMSRNTDIPKYPLNIIEFSLDSFLVLFTFQPMLSKATDFSR